MEPKVEYEEYIARLEAQNSGLNRQLIMQSIVIDNLQKKLTELEGKVAKQNGRDECSDDGGDEEITRTAGRQKQSGAVSSG